MTTPTATRPGAATARHARPARSGRPPARCRARLGRAAAALLARGRRFDTAARLAWRAITHAPVHALLTALPTAAGAAVVTVPCALALQLTAPAAAGIGPHTETLTILLVGLPGCALLGSGGRLVRLRHHRRSTALRRLGIGPAQVRVVTMLEAAAAGLTGATCAALAVTLGGGTAGTLLPADDRLGTSLTATHPRPLPLAAVVAAATLLAALAAFGLRAPSAAARPVPRTTPLARYGLGPVLLATGLTVSFVFPTHAVVTRTRGFEGIVGPARLGVALLTLAGVALSLPFLLRSVGRLIVPRGDAAVSLLAGRGIEAAAVRDARVLAPATVLSAAVAAVAVLRLSHASALAVLGVPVTGPAGQALVAGAVVAVLASGVALLCAAHEAPERRRRVAALHALGVRPSKSRLALVLAATVPSLCALGTAVTVGALLALPGALTAPPATSSPSPGGAASGDVSVMALGVPLAAAAVVLLALPALGAAIADRRDRQPAALRFE